MSSHMRSVGIAPVAGHQSRAHCMPSMLPMPHLGVVAVHVREGSVAAAPCRVLPHRYQDVRVARVIGIVVARGLARVRSEERARIAGRRRASAAGREQAALLRRPCCPRSRTHVPLRLSLRAAFAAAACCSHAPLLRIHGAGDARTRQPRRGMGGWEEFGGATLLDCCGVAAESKAESR